MNEDHPAVRPDVQDLADREQAAKTVLADRSSLIAMQKDDIARMESIIKDRDTEVDRLRTVCERLRVERNYSENMMYLMKHAAEDEARGEPTP